MDLMRLPFRIALTLIFFGTIVTFEVGRAEHHGVFDDSQPEFHIPVEHRFSEGGSVSHRPTRNFGRGIAPEKSDEGAKSDSGKRNGSLAQRIADLPKQILQAFNDGKKLGEQADRLIKTKGAGSNQEDRDKLSEDLSKKAGEIRDELKKKEDLKGTEEEKELNKLANELEQQAADIRAIRDAARGDTASVGALADAIVGGGSYRDTTARSADTLPPSSWVGETYQPTLLEPQVSETHLSSTPAADVKDTSPSKPPTETPAQRSVSLPPIAAPARTAPAPSEGSPGFGPADNGAVTVRVTGPRYDSALTSSAEYFADAPGKTPSGGTTREIDRRIDDFSPSSSTQVAIPAAPIPRQPAQAAETGSSTRAGVTSPPAIDPLSVKSLLESSRNESVQEAESPSAYRPAESTTRTAPPPVALSLSDVRETVARAPNSPTPSSVVQEARGDTGVGWASASVVSNIEDSPKTASEEINSYRPDPGRDPNTQGALAAYRVPTDLEDFLGARPTRISATRDASKQEGDDSEESALGQFGDFAREMRLGQRPVSSLESRPSDLSQFQRLTLPAISPDGLVGRP